MNKLMALMALGLAVLAAYGAAADEPEMRGNEMMMDSPMSNMPMGSRMMMREGPSPAQGMMSMMGWGGMAVGTVDGHLAFLKTEIGIKPEQEALWQDFAATIRENAEGMRTSHHWEHIYGATGIVERLARYEKHLSARLDMLHKAQAKLGPLYAALGDDQKRRADDILFGHMEHM